MNITVLSRKEIEAIELSDRHAVVSVRSPFARAPRLRHPRHSPPRVLPLVFSDAVLVDGVPTLRPFAHGERHAVREIRLFDDGMARIVAMFVRQFRDKELYFHCLGGISRSVALAKAFEDVEGAKVRYGPIASPNPHILETMRLALLRRGAAA